MWLFGDKEIHSHEDLDHECTDIVYTIVYESGRAYIGKKCVRSISTLPVLKTKGREEAELITRHILRDELGKIVVGASNKRKARLRGCKAKAEYYEKVLTNKPFIKYEGSSEHTKDEVVVSKHIMFQVSTKKTASYLENKLLYEVDAIVNEEYLNANIAGTYFEDSLDGLIDIK